MTQDPYPEDLQRLIGEALTPDDLQAGSPHEIESLLDDATSVPLDDARVERILNRSQIRNTEMSTTTQHAHTTTRATASTQPIPTGTYYAAGALAAVLLIIAGFFLGIGWGEGGNGSSGNTPAADNPETKSEIRLVSNPVAGGSGLRPRRREPGAAPTVVAVGDAIETGRGERRRVALPDGSILYVNEQTKLRIEAERRVQLDHGEVFAEVATVAAKTPRRKERFVIASAGREVTALGTKFAVRNRQDQTGVLVTQGKVQVGGYDQSLVAGQQLLMDGEQPPKLTDAARASHQLAWTRDLMAAADSPLVPGSKYAGGALLAVDPHGQEARLSLRKYHVDVHIENGFARTTIDQTYFNHQSWRMEGTFYFPLPPDASLSRLAMYVGPKLMEGGMAEREHARDVFEQIVYSQRDPALLEWVDGSTFKMRVFPLEGRQEKRIIISYTQKLISHYGKTTYRFPAGHNLEVVRDWSVAMRVKDGDKLHWDSPSHELLAERTKGDLLLTADHRAVKVDKDVVLTLQKDGGEKSAPIRFETSQLDGHKYFMVRCRPALPTKPRSQQRHWVVLFETSADRDPLLARTQIDVLSNLLDNAEHNDTFSIVTAATRVGTFSDKPLPCTRENIARAAAFLDRVHLVGALDLAQAFTACRPLVEGRENTHLLHLGSGVAVLGEREQDELLELLPAETTYVGIGVGKRWDRALMKEAARQTGGFFTQINPDEPIRWRAFELLATLNAPRMLDISVAGDDNRWQFLPFADSAIDGEEICAVARAAADEPLPHVVTLAGTIDGEPFQAEMPVEDVSEKAAYLPRGWARLQIDRLVAESATENKDKIIALSKQSYVMSPFTSLLVLESEQMYKQFNIDRGRKDHWAMYPCPDEIEVVHEPLPGIPGGPAGPMPTGDVDPTQQKQQVMQTINVRIAPRILYWPNVGYRGYRVLNAWQLYSGAFALPYAGESWFGARRGVVFLGDGLDTTLRWPILRGTMSDVSGVLDLQSGQQQVFNGPISHSWSLGTKSRGISRLGVTITNGFSLPGRGVDGEFRFIDFSGRGPRFADLGRITQSEESLLQSVNGRWVSDRIGVDDLLPLGIDSDEILLFEREELLRAEQRLMNDLRPLYAPTVPPARNAEWLTWAIQSGRRRNYLTYQRPYMTGDVRVFRDLLAYAPGMNTNRDDVSAAIEAEATALPPARVGKIDDVARRLIERARRREWELVRLPANHEFGGEIELRHDYTGRYLYSRSLNGLREEVVCDGDSLWHLYRELGVGARRSVNRFQRVRFAKLVPWTLPPVEELARDAKLVAIDERTVAIVPLDRRAKSAEKVEQDEKGKQQQLVIHLVFDEETGRLAERRIVDRDGGNVLLRATYGADGAVEQFNDQGESTGSVQVARDGTEEASLEANVRDLVVLPMPLRTEAHFWAASGKTNDGKYADWNDEDALALIAAKLTQDTGGLQQVIGQRFFRRGDRRLGFYTILLSSGTAWNPQQDLQFDGKTVRFDAAADHPDSPLAKYVDGILHFHQQQQRGQQAIPRAVAAPADSFIGELSQFRTRFHEWNSGRATSSAAGRQAEYERTVELIETCRNPRWGWAMFSVMQNHGMPNKPERLVDLAESMKRYETVPGLAYTASYERGSLLSRAGKKPQAQELFAKLFSEALEGGVLLPIDSTLRSSLQAADDKNNWEAMLRKATQRSIENGNAAGAVYLALQCQMAGDANLAEQLLSAALAGGDSKDRLAVSLSAIDFLWHTSQLPRADAIIAGLLADEEIAKQAAVWRLAAAIANQRGKLALMLKRQQRALDLEFEELPELVNLAAVRHDYAQLLAQYKRLADAIATLETEPPNGFIERIVAATDRWRALDHDDTAAAQAASAIFTSLGRKELAWDYLTTPLADKPNEAAPWLSMAQNLRGQGEFELSARSYALAYEVEPTNAQILWDHAQLLLRMNRPVEARRRFQQLADGKWQPRFNWIQSQAKQFMRANPIQN